MESNEARLKAIGLDAATIKNILKGKNSLQNLLNTLDLVGVKECEKKTGSLLYAVSTRITPSLENRRAIVASYVSTGKIASNP